MKLKTITLLCLVAAAARAQSPAPGQEETQAERVQYTFIMPDEKVPELLKEDENSPFESTFDAEKEAVGTTEENQVRDILTRLPAVGGASGASGMRVMLGGMRLVEGGDVPPVLPDQQVRLKVKSITSSAIELVWVEKRPTGLPPKVLTIPLDSAPRVRYQLPPNPTAPDGAKGAPTMGSIRRNGVAVLQSPSELPNAKPPVMVAAALSDTTRPAVRITSTSNPTPDGLPAPAPLPPPSDIPEASVLRMLFGNHAPAAK